MQQRLRDRYLHFVVVAEARQLFDVGCRPQLAEDVHAGRIEPRLRNASDHAVVLKTAAGVRAGARQAAGVITNGVEQRAVVVARL